MLMERVRQLSLVLAFMVAPAALSQTFVVDQANEVFYSPDTFNIEYFHPMGQEFRPTLSSLDFVELMLWDFFSPGGYQIGELAVSIRAGTIDGPVLATSSPLFLQPTFDGVGHFDFATPVPLTPGATYVLQVDVVAGGDWGAGGSGTSSYPDGREIRQGIPLEDDDLYFREGITIIPEPNALTCLVLGGAVFYARAKCFGR